MSAPALPFEAGVPTDVKPAKPAPEPLSGLGLMVASNIELGVIGGERSLQTTVGASEIGYPCARRLAYRLAGVPAVNLGDPLRLLLGTGVHLALEAIHHRLDRGGTRFLTEIPTVYRGVPGTVDLFDNFLHVALDWKTSTKERLTKYVKDGPPVNYRVQVQLYGLGLREAGHQVQRVGLVFLPITGGLDSLWVWETTPDATEVDSAIDRLESLRGKDPADVAASPDRLCAHCAHYNPRTTDLSRACPGNTRGNLS